MGYDSRKCSCFWELFVSFCRFWGVITAIVLWGVGGEVIYRGYALGAYLLLAALLMSILESVFVVHFWTQVCLSDDDDDDVLCARGTRTCLWFDDWKKGLLYVVIAVGCFIRPHQIWLAAIAGVMVVISGILYIVKTFRLRLQAVPGSPSSNTYDRFDDDNVEIGGTNVVANGIQFSRDSLANQDEIFEV